MMCWRLAALSKAEVPRTTHPSLPLLYRIVIVCENIRGRRASLACKEDTLESV